MELFLSDQQPADTLSLSIELFSNYVRAPQRDVIQVTTLTQQTLKALKIESVPLLVKSVSQTQEDGTVVQTEQRLTSPFAIMLEISKACYLENVLFGKPNSVERSEVGQFIETVGRMEGKEFAEYINEHMATKMFLVSENITAADVVALA